MPFFFLRCASFLRKRKKKDLVQAFARLFPFFFSFPCLSERKTDGTKAHKVNVARQTHPTKRSPPTRARGKAGGLPTGPHIEKKKCKRTSKFFQEKFETAVLHEKGVFRGCPQKASFCALASGSIPTSFRSASRAPKPEGNQKETACSVLLPIFFPFFLAHRSPNTKAAIAVLLKRRPFRHRPAFRKRKKKGGDRSREWCVVTNRTLWRDKSRSPESDLFFLPLQAAKRKQDGENANGFDCRGATERLCPTTFSSEQQRKGKTFSPLLSLHG